MGKGGRDGCESGKTHEIRRGIGVFRIASPG
jgi:hypothetical protein